MAQRKHGSNRFIKILNLNKKKRIQKMDALKIIPLSDPRAKLKQAKQ